MKAEEFAAAVKTAKEAWERGERKPMFDLIIRNHLGALNALEPHLGCVLCKEPLDAGRCSTCQGEEV